MQIFWVFKNLKQLLVQEKLRPDFDYKYLITFKNPFLVHNICLPILEQIFLVYLLNIALSDKMLTVLVVHKQIIHLNIENMVSLI